MVKIIITGATGNLGSRTLQHLLTSIPPQDLIVSLYNPNSDAADYFRKKGIEVRKGDFNKPETLKETFKGGDKLLLVSVPSFNDEERVSAHRNAINAAKASGITHIYYTSLAIASTSKAAVMQAHLHTEEIIKESGLTYTIIREGNYVDNLPIFFGFWKKADDEVIVPGDGPIHWASWNDLAIGTAKIVASENYKNQTVSLVGNLVTMEEGTKILAKILNKKIQFKKESLEEWLKRHDDKIHAKQWSSTYPAIEAGDWNITDPLLEELVGRPLVSFEERANEILNDDKKAGEVFLKHNYLE